MAYQLQGDQRSHPSRREGLPEECDFSFRRRVRGAATASSTAPRRVPSYCCPALRLGQDHHGSSLEEELERRGIPTTPISMDNYFRTMNPKIKCCVIPRGAIDYDLP